MNAQGSSARGACGPGTRKSGGVELGVGNAAKERRGGAQVPEVRSWGPSSLRAQPREHNACAVLNRRCSVTVDETESTGVPLLACACRTVSGCAGGGLRWRPVMTASCHPPGRCQAQGGDSSCFHERVQPGDVSAGFPP